MRRGRLAAVLGLLVLSGCTRRPSPPPAAPSPSPARTESAAPRLGLVAPAPARAVEPRTVLVRRVVTHHLPGPRVPPPIPTPSGVTQLWLTPLPAPDRRPLVSAWVADPLADDLRDALGRGGGELTGGVRLVLPSPGSVKLDGRGPVIVAPADAGEPPSRWAWQPWVPEGLASYRRELGEPRWRSGRLGQRQAIWLSSGVRAGWWAERPEALAVLRAALAAVGPVSRG